MQAIRTKYIYRLLQANLCMMTILLLGLSLAVMEVVNLHGVLTRLSDVRVLCLDGITEEEEQSGQSLETLAANYNPPPYKPGLLGLAIWETLESDKSHYSVTSIHSTMGMEL